MLTHGVVAAVRVVKNHSKSTSIVFLLYLQQFVSTVHSLLCASKVATELQLHWFAEQNKFRFTFSTTSNLQNAMKIAELVRFGM